MFVERLRSNSAAPVRSGGSSSSSSSSYAHNNSHITTPIADNARLATVAAIGSRSGSQAHAACIARASESELCDGVWSRERASERDCARAHLASYVHLNYLKALAYSRTAAATARKCA